jgi:hypothetical protein
MSNNIAKSQSLIRALKDQLSKRLPAYTIQESLVNSAGDTLMISQSASPTAGQNNVAIRIGFQDTQFTDVIGLPQSVYTPMRADIIQEATAASASVSLCQMAFQQAIAAELDKMGIRERWYLNANGTVPAVSEFAADGSVTTAVLQIELAPDQYWPLSGQ